MSESEADLAALCGEMTELLPSWQSGLVEGLFAFASMMLLGAGVFFFALLIEHLAFRPHGVPEAGEVNTHIYRTPQLVAPTN